MASISGNVTIAGDPDDWIACAFDAATHAYAASAAVSEGSYTISGLTASKAYMVACRPKTGPAWAATRETVVNDYTVPVSPASTPYLFKATTAQAGDEYFNNVSLLLHCDGTNGSTTFTDSSSNGLTVTPSGDAKLSTSDPKFGSASAIFDGSGDYLSVSSSAPIQFGTGDFTLECWIKLNSSLAADVAIMSRRASAGTRGIVWQWTNSTSVLSLYVGDTSGGWDVAFSSSVTCSKNAWHHVAVTRASNVYRLFVDGQVGTTSATWSGTIADETTTALKIGAVDTSSLPMYGLMDDIRITKGVARYTGDFTAPVSAFANTGSALTGGSEPSWDTTPGNTTSDGDVTWTNMGRLVQPLMQGPLIAA